MNDPDESNFSAIRTSQTSNETKTRYSDFIQIPKILISEAQREIYQESCFLASVAITLDSGVRVEK